MSPDPKLKVQVRRVDGEKEKELLRALQKEILPEDTPDYTGSGWWWVARTDSGLPIGFCGIKPSIKWSDTMYLCRAGVLDAFQGKGLQKRLIRVRERFAKELGMNWLITDTYHNPASSNSLISCGFKLFIPSDPWAAKGALHWRKRISKETPPTKEAS